MSVNKFLDTRAIALDADGRISLSDAELLSLESELGEEAFAGGGGLGKLFPNFGCSNTGDCTGSSNTTCFNQSACSGSLNQNLCSG